MKKTLFATGGIVASIFLGASVTFTRAETISPTRQGFVQKTHLVRKGAEARMSTMAATLGLNSGEITKEQMATMFAGARIHGLKKNGTSTREYVRTKAPSSLVQAEARALGLSIDDLKKQLQNRKTLAEIVVSQGLTQTQYHQNLASELSQLIDSGAIKGKKVDFYKKMIAKLRA